MSHDARWIARRLDVLRWPVVDCGHVSRDVANADAQLSAVRLRRHVLASQRLTGPCQPPRRCRRPPLLETFMTRPSAFTRPRPAPRGLHQLGLRVLVRLYGPTDGPEPTTGRGGAVRRDRDGLAPCR